jgi:hypothetical protein
MEPRLYAAAHFFAPATNLRKNLHHFTIPLDSRFCTIYIVLQERVALRRNRASRPGKGAIHEEESQEGRQENP